MEQEIKYNQTFMLFLPANLQTLSYATIKVIWELYSKIISIIYSQLTGRESWKNIYIRIKKRNIKIKLFYRNDIYNMYIRMGNYIVLKLQ